MKRKNINFWCDTCNADVSSAARFVPINGIIGYGWKGTCVCGAKLVRLEDKHAREDPYFRKSRMVRASLRKHADDVLQYGQNGFSKKNPHVQREIDQRKRAEDMERWEEERKTKTQL